MIVGINGQPWIALDQYLDVPSFEALHYEIAWGLANAKSRIAIAGPGMLPGEGRELMGLSRDLALRLPPEHPGYRYMLTASEQADPELLWRYVYWGFGGVSLGTTVYLALPMSYETKHLPSHTTEQWNVRLFPGLMAYVKTMPFKQVGRIVLFLTDARNSGLIHRDHAVPPAVPDEFIWMRTRPNKQLFILDADSGQRFPVTASSAWFNTADYHGTEAGPDASFSFRVDGVFTEEFREKVNRG